MKEKATMGKLKKLKKEKSIGESTKIQKLKDNASEDDDILKNLKTDL